MAAPVGPRKFNRGDVLERIRHILGGKTLKENNNYWGWLEGSEHEFGIHQDHVDRWLAEFKDDWNPSLTSDQKWRNFTRLTRDWYLNRGYNEFLKVTVFTSRPDESDPPRQFLKSEVHDTRIVNKRTHEARVKSGTKAPSAGAAGAGAEEGAAAAGTAAPAPVSKYARKGNSKPKGQAAAGKAAAGAGGRKKGAGAAAAAAAGGEEDDAEAGGEGYPPARPQARRGARKPAAGSAAAAAAAAAAAGGDGDGYGDEDHGEVQGGLFEDNELADGYGGSSAPAAAAAAAAAGTGAGAARRRRGPAEGLLSPLARALGSPPDSRDRDGGATPASGLDGLDVGELLLGLSASASNSLDPEALDDGGYDDDEDGGLDGDDEDGLDDDAAVEEGDGVEGGYGAAAGSGSSGGGAAAKAAYYLDAVRLAREAATSSSSSCAAAAAGASGRKRGRPPVRTAGGAGSEGDSDGAAAAAVALGAARPTARHASAPYPPLDGQLAPTASSAPAFDFPAARRRPALGGGGADAKRMRLSSESGFSTAGLAPALDAAAAAMAAAEEELDGDGDEDSDGEAAGAGGGGGGGAFDLSADVPPSPKRARPKQPLSRRQAAVEANRAGAAAAAAAAAGAAIAAEEKRAARKRAAARARAPLLEFPAAGEGPPAGDDGDADGDAAALLLQSGGVPRQHSLQPAAGDDFVPTQQDTQGSQTGGALVRSDHSSGMGLSLCSPPSSSGSGGRSRRLSGSLFAGSQQQQLPRGDGEDGTVHSPSHSALHSQAPPLSQSASPSSSASTAASAAVRMTSLTSATAASVGSGEDGGPGGGTGQDDGHALTASSAGPLRQAPSFGGGAAQLQQAHASDSQLEPLPFLPGPGKPRRPRRPTQARPTPEEAAMGGGMHHSYGTGPFGAPGPGGGMQWSQGLHGLMGGSPRMPMPTMATSMAVMQAQAQAQAQFNLCMTAQSLGMQLLRGLPGGMGAGLLGGFPGMTPPGGFAGMTPPGGFSGMMPPGGFSGMTPPGGFPGMTPPGGFPGMTPPGGFPGAMGPPQPVHMMPPAFGGPHMAHGPHPGTGAFPPHAAGAAVSRVDSYQALSAGATSGGGGGGGGQMHPGWAHGGRNSSPFHGPPAPGYEGGASSSSSSSSGGGGGGPAVGQAAPLALDPGSGGHTAAEGGAVPGLVQHPGGVASLGSDVYQAEAYQ